MPNIRKQIFSTIDFLKGDPVKDHKANIKSLYKDNNSQLSKLLIHAVTSTEFYKSYDPYKLSSFPIINKTLIKQNNDSFLSNVFKKENLIAVTTSGSTGTPFTVFIDKNKKNRNTADTIVFAEKAGYDIGQKLYYLKIWSEANRKSFFTTFSQNIEMVDVLLLDQTKIERLISKWKSEKGEFGIIGYASALETICKYLVSKNFNKIESKVNSIITISESLNPEVKKKLSDIFGVPVSSRYSNVENGIIAQQSSESNGDFEINTASYKIEIFSLTEDAIVTDGGIGRIVLTDLYNFGMPLIRYDTGDIGAIKELNGKLYLSQLSGRKLDVLYNTEGQIVNSLLVYRNMWQYTEIDQYQLIQRGVKSYTFKVCSTAGFARSEKLIQEYKEYLGNDAIINIEMVHEIPLLSSGKRRKVVQEHYK